MSKMEEYSQGAIDRVSTVRVRTWSVTLAIVISLVLYLLMDVITKSVDWVTFVFVATLQIVIHFIYFPDGEIYGTKDSSFKSNRKTYNENAVLINKNQLGKKMRDYCKYEYEVRQKRYIENECSLIGITVAELDELVIVRTGPAQLVDDVGAENHLRSDACGDSIDGIRFRG